MAIIVKVEADTEELDRSIEKSAEKAKSEFEKTGIGKSIESEQKKASSAFDQIAKDAQTAARASRDAFAFSPEQQARIDSMRGGLGDLQEKASALQGRLDAIPASSSRAALALGGVAVAAAAGTAAIIAMAKAGSENAEKLLEQAKTANKSVEEFERLKIGSRDLTAELNALGGILDKQTIEKAAAATDQFSLLGKQFDALKIQIAAELNPAFTSIGKTVNSVFVAIKPAILEVVNVLGLIAKAMSDAIQKIFSLHQWAKQNVPGYGQVATAVNEVATSSISTLVMRSINQFRETPIPTAPTKEGRSINDLATLLKTGRLPDGSSAATAGLAPAPSSPRLSRVGGGGSGLDRPPDLPQEAQEALDRVEFAIDLMGKNLNQLAEIQARNSTQLEEARSKQLELEQRNLTTTKEYLVLREQTIKLENRNLELLGAKLTQIEQGGVFNVKLPLGAKPGLEGPSLQVPTITKEQALAPLVEASEERRIARANQRLLDELQEQYEHWRDNVTGILEQTFADGFRRGPGNFFTRIIESLKETIQRIVFSQLAQRVSGAITPTLFNLFGGGQAPGVASSGGGGIGGLLGGLLGGARAGGFGGFLTPPFNPNAGNSIGIPNSISTISAQAAGIAGIGLDPTTTLGRAAGVTAGGFSTGSLLGGLAGLAPILGIGLGSSLGGSSTAGKIVGGIGGGILGAAAGIFATGSTLGLGVTTALLLSNPFTIAAGIGLLVGSVLLGKASQRKKDEKAADAIWVNELNQIRQLVAQVNSDRIDGQEALGVASQLRQQTIAGLNQIKTKSVRESRLTNQIRDLDNGVVAELRRAVERQQQRQRIGPQLIPEFATGGRVPGLDRGFDSVLALVRPGEAVLNQQQIALLGGPSALRRARVPGFDNGGRVPMTTPSSRGDAAGPMTIILEGVTVDAESIFVKGARTSGGQRVAVQVQRNARLDRRG